jgi:hypothetical protein
MQSVQVIIERLKTNPEDFFGEIAPKRVSRVPPKFEEMTQKLDDLIAEKNVGHIHRLWFLNEDEKDALIEAYKEARRARFEAKTFHELLSPQDIPEEQELNVITRRHPATGKYMMPTGGIVAPASMVEQTTKILRDEFDKAYAKNRNT